MESHLKQKRFSKEKLSLALVFVLLTFLAPCGTRNTTQEVFDLPVTDQLSPAKSALVVNNNSTSDCSSGPALKFDSFKLTVPTKTKNNDLELDYYYNFSNLFAGHLPPLLSNEFNTGKLSVSFQRVALYILYNKPKILPGSYS